MIAHRKERKGRDPGYAFIDRHGKKVTWTELTRDAKRGIAHFWEKRGGRPETTEFAFGGETACDEEE